MMVLSELRGVRSVLHGNDLAAQKPLLEILSSNAYSWSAAAKGLLWPNSTSDYVRDVITGSLDEASQCDVVGHLFVLLCKVVGLRRWYDSPRGLQE